LPELFELENIAGAAGRERRKAIASMVRLLSKCDAETVAYTSVAELALA
jgi:hypothetical protein